MSPWSDVGWSGASVSSDTFSVGSQLTRSRKLLKNPFGYVWYLSERVSAPYSTSFMVSVDPLSSMFQLNSPLDLAMIDDLYVEGIYFDALVIGDVDYGVFRQARLVPPIVRHEIRTRVALQKLVFGLWIRKGRRILRIFRCYLILSTTCHFLPILKG